MGLLSWTIKSIGGRRVLLLLGATYVAAAAGLPLTRIAESQPVADGAIDSLLVGASGLALSYGGYRLPRTDIRPDIFHVVAAWCFRALAAMLTIVTLSFLAGSVSDPTAGFLVLPALATVAGLGMGYHDAHSKTRALDAEERQREAERYSRELERYQTIVETVNDGIYITDADGRFTLVNDAYCELVGYDREELLGSSSSLVLAEEADVEALFEEVERDLAEGTADSNMYETVLETASGERVEAEWTFSALSGHEDGVPDTVGIVRDVSERNRRQRQLERQNERLESFAAMIAHELRNPVNIGQIYGQQLPRESNPEAVEHVTEAFDRIENMIDILLVITRGREAMSERSAVDLAEVAAEAWDEVDAPDARVEVTVDRTIRANETYVRHLFRNLFENAVEHGGGDVTVTVGELADAAESGGSVDESVGGFYVADDGPGIPPDDREAVFGTGYTTTANQGGMGLGLTFVRELADVYGWTCSVTESADGGARFEFENVATVRSATN